MSERCRRCGAQLEVAAEVMTLGSARPVSLVYDECPCPILTCPSCERRLDEHQRCTTMDCPIYNTFVPIPDHI